MISNAVGKDHDHHCTVDSFGADYSLHLSKASAENPACNTDGVNTMDEYAKMSSNRVL